MGTHKMVLAVLVIFVILAMACSNAADGCWLVTDEDGREYEARSYEVTGQCINMFEGPFYSGLIGTVCGKVSVRPCE